MSIPHNQFQISGPDSQNEFSESFVSTGSILRTDKNFSVKEFYTFSNTESVNRKGQKFARTTFSTLLSGSVYTMSASDYLIAITSLSYSPSIGLPRPKFVGVGKTYIIKDETGGASTTTITIRSAGEETIDGAATSTLTTNYTSKSFYSDGANWFTY